MVNGDRQLDKLYAARFTAKQLKAKEKLWKILCSQFLQRYVPHESTVVDLGAGFCEFINNIECRTKFAVDVAPHAVRYANSGVVVKSTLSELPSSSVDVVFCSNFFEHLPSKEKMVQILLEVCRVLRPLGTVMIIQPNITSTMPIESIGTILIIACHSAIVPWMKYCGLSAFKSYSSYRTFSPIRPELPWCNYLFSSECICLSHFSVFFLGSRCLFWPRRHRDRQGWAGPLERPLRNHVRRRA